MYGTISYRFQDKGQFASKIANFSNPRVFNAQLRGFPWNLVLAQGAEKLE